MPSTRSGKVLAYVFGRRKDEVFVELKKLLSHLESSDTVQMVGGHTNDIPAECHRDR